MRYTIIFLTSISFLIYSCKKENDYKVTHLNTNWVLVNKLSSKRTPQKVTSITCDRQNNVWASFVWDSTYRIDSVYVSSHSGNSYWQYIDTTIHLSYISKIKGTAILNIIDKSTITNLDKPVSSLGFDKNNILYIGTTIGYGLIQYNFKSCKIYFPSNVGTVYDFNRFVFDTKNNLWFGAGNCGLFKFDGSKFSEYTRANSNMTYPEKVQYINFDSKGDIWFFTENDLLKFEENQLKVIPFSSLRVIYGMAIDNNDNIILIAHSNLNDRYELEKVSYKSTDKFAQTENTPLPSNVNWFFINDLVIDSKNNIWMATEFEGLLMFDGNKLTIYNTTNSQIQSNHLTKLFIDKYENIWIGSNDSGLSIFNSDGVSY